VRSWEGAQPGSQPKLTIGNIPYHGHHAEFMNGHWLGGQESVLHISMSLNPLLAGSSNFSRSLVFFGSFMKFVISRFCDRCSGTGCEPVTGWWEKLYCI